MNSVLASILATQFIAPDSAVSGARAVIPYRTEMPVSAGSIAFSLSVTLLVLLALVALIVYARHRGWAGRFSSGGIPGERTVPKESIEVSTTRRVSMTTTAHVVVYRGYEYLIVESSRGSTAAVTPLGSTNVESGVEP